MRDVFELNLLSGLQNKRTVTSRVNAQNNAAINAMISRSNQMAAAVVPQSNGVVPEPSAPTEAIDDVGNLINRSPTTHSHYYMAPVVEPLPATAKTANPWPWVALITAMILATTLAGFLWLREGHKPQPAPVKPSQEGQYGLGLDDLKVF